jgi:reactive intermediate/imine deaminase
MNIFKYSALILTLLLTSHVAIAAHTTQVEFLNTEKSSPRLPFSEGVRVNNIVYLSGKIGLNPETKLLAKGGIKAEAKQTLENIKDSLNKYGFTMNQVVKCMVMLTDINDFKAFNEVYSSYFKLPYPVRSAFSVSELALGASVEIECMAVVGK